MGWVERIYFDSEWWGEKVEIEKLGDRESLWMRSMGFVWSGLGVEKFVF